MAKNINYGQIIDLIRSLNLNYACIYEPTEVCSSAMFNGLNLIDTSTYEIPCSFNVDRALFVCLNDVPKDTTEYTDVAYTLSEYKPQFIALKGGFVKLMCWCTFEGESEFLSPIEFESICLKALNKSYINGWFDEKVPLDFRVSFRRLGEYNFEHYKAEFDATTTGIKRMYNFVKECGEFDCEIYANYEDGAEVTGNGVFGHTTSENDFPLVMAY